MRALRAAAVALVATVWTSACGALLGFEDAIDMRDEGGLADVSGDGLVVASDAAGVVCVPTLPQEWQGPYIVYEARGAALPTPPDCPDSYVLTYDGHATPNAQTPDCACQCAAPAGATCTPPQISFFTTANCAATSACGNPKTQNVGTTCTAWDLTGCGGTHFTLTTPAPTGGSCAPSAPQMTLPTWSWTAEVRLCAFRGSAGGACPDGKMATPATGLPFDPKYCVARKGEAACPPTYPSARTYYESFTDERACDPCTCSEPQGITCAGPVVTGGVSTCTGGQTYATLPLGCTNDPKQAGIYKGAASGGSCTPQAHPNGTVAPTTPTTICCIE